MSVNSCTFCGGVLTTRLPAVADVLTGESFAILACGGCGLGITHPQPTNLAAYYPAEYYGFRHGTSARWCSARRLRWARRFTRDAVGRKLLDVGCGEGTFLRAARSEGWIVAGTELNPTTMCIPGIPIVGSLSSVREFGPFDLVTLWHSFEHMRDPQQILFDIRGVITGKGVLLIAVPDFGSLQARLFGSAWLHLDVPRHLFHFTYTSLTRLLEKTGFQVIQHWHREIEYDLMGWSQSALNRVLTTPNVLLRLLTGKPVQAQVAEIATSCVLGPIFSGLALPLLAIESLFQHGGTLVIAAHAS